MFSHTCAQKFCSLPENSSMKNLLLYKRRSFALSGALFLLLLFVFAAERWTPARLSAQSTGAQSTSTTRAAESVAQSSNSTSRSRSATELQRKIDEAIEASEFRSARWGVYVLSLRDGRTVAAREGDKPFTPASNMKVYTTAVALDTLGADYRWRTSVYAAREPDARGLIDDDLVLYGRGAPDLSSRTEKETPDHLAQLADELYRRGVRRVRGDLIGDESYLRGEPLGDGWLWNDVQWYYGAEVSALTINDNEATVTITPGKPGEAADAKLEEDAGLLNLTNDAQTSARGSSLTIGVTRGLSDNNVRVWGEFPATGRSYARARLRTPARALGRDPLS